MKLAPICIFTYNRLSTLQNTIDALSHNYLIDDSVIYIFSDGSKNNEDSAKVEAVRSYLKKKIPFKNYELIFREKNIGLSKSIITGVTDIINKHERVIVIEDDIFTSKNFLLFLNKSLAYYKNDNNIYSVSVFSFPMKPLITYKYDTFLSLRPFPWGWGTWKDQWAEINWDIESVFEKFSFNKRAKNDFCKGGQDLFAMLNNHVKGKIDSWDTVWAFNQYLQQKFSVFPTISKTINYGFNADSTHTKGFNIFNTKLDLSNNQNFNFCASTNIDDEILKSFKNKFSYQKKIRERLK